ncbi:MAG: hypothetical protein ACLFVD_02650 [Dehalococcoidia bacterium]
MTVFCLIMRRGKRFVFIGLFPSEYRATVVACNLEWCGWTGIIQETTIAPQMPVAKEVQP